MVHLTRSMPATENVFAALVASTWKDCLSRISSSAESESPHLFLLAWTQVVLTTTGLATSERTVETGARIILTSLHECENRAEQRGRPS